MVLSLKLSVVKGCVPDWFYTKENEAGAFLLVVSYVHFAYFI